MAEINTPEGQGMQGQAMQQAQMEQTQQMMQLMEANNQILTNVFEVMNAGNQLQTKNIEEQSRLRGMLENQNSMLMQLIEEKQTVEEPDRSFFGG